MRPEWCQADVFITDIYILQTIQSILFLDFEDCFPAHIFDIYGILKYTNVHLKISQ